MKDSNLKIIREYKTLEWVNWINDIMYFGIAYPFNTLSAEGDVLIDVIKLMRSEDLSTKEYELALISVLNSKIGLQPEIRHIFRILNTLILLKSPYSTNALIDIFYSTALSNIFHKEESLKAKVFQALARLTLSDEQKRNINLFVKNKLLGEFAENVALMGNYLRFIFLNFPEQVFFESMTMVIDVIQGDISEKWRPYALTTLEDKFKEFYFHKSFCFFGYFYKWLNESYVTLSISDLYQKLLENLFVTFRKRYDDFIKDNKDIDEQVAANVAIVSLGCISNKKYFENIPAEKLNEVLFHLFSKEGNVLAKAIGQKNQRFIFDNFDTYMEDYNEPDFSFNGEILSPNRHSSLIGFLKVYTLESENTKESINHSRDILIRELHEFQIQE